MPATPRYKSPLTDLGQTYVSGRQRVRIGADRQLIDGRDGSLIVNSGESADWWERNMEKCELYEIVLRYLRAADANGWRSPLETIAVRKFS